jgi:hypothetical protein
LISGLMKLVLGIVIFMLVAYGQENAPESRTNLQIADSLTVLFLEDNLAQIRGNKADSLALDVSLIDPEIQNYLRVLLGNWFLKNSFQVFRNYNARSSFQGMVLELNTYRFKVIYSKPYEKKFLGSDYVQREVSIDINGQFYHAGKQKVELAVNKNERYHDEIVYSDIVRIEQSAFAFTKGKRQDYSFWDKLYEPVLAVASVAIVVYLFFSQRT